MIAAHSKLKWLVVLENYEIETATFWKAPKEYGGPPPSQIQTEVFQLPTSGFAEKDGSFTNSARWVQWKWKAARSTRAGEDRPGGHRADLPRATGALPEGGRGAARSHPQHVLELHSSDGAGPGRGAEGDQRLGGGGRLRAVHRSEAAEEAPRRGRQAARKLRSASRRRVDGVRTLALHRRLHRGGEQWPSGGALPTPPGSGCSISGGSAGLRTGASCTTAPPPIPRASRGIPTRPGIVWNGQRWVGDVPDIAPDSPPGKFGPFIMLPEGVGRLFAASLTDGPFPEHYEPVEAPIANPLHPKVTSNPAVRRFTTAEDKYGSAKEFPIVCTTYRVTEMYHYWTKHTDRLNEIPARVLHRASGRARQGEWNHQRLAGACRLRTRCGAGRGHGHQTPQTDDRRRQIGLAHRLPPALGVRRRAQSSRAAGQLHDAHGGDANTWTPEYKCFLVRIEKGQPLSTT